LTGMEDARNLDIPWASGMSTSYEMAQTGYLKLLTKRS